jgi:flavin reductase (DIM6/NTAB) family NADH-FMN oxidoreductase RutF
LIFILKATIHLLKVKTVQNGINREPGMKDSIRQVFQKMTYGLYVLTALHNQKAHAMVVSWVSQISYDPPLALVGVRYNRPLIHIIPEAGFFGLNLLQKNQIPLVSGFKLGRPEENPDWMERKTASGVPILKGAGGYLELKLEAMYSPGDHTLFVGRIMDGGTMADAEPLSTIDYGGVYIGER